MWHVISITFMFHVKTKLFYGYSVLKYKEKWQCTKCTEHILKNQVNVKANLYMITVLIEKGGQTETWTKSNNGWNGRIQNTMMVNVN